MHGVQLPDLYEPCTNSLHDLPPCIESLPPVSFPFEQVAGVEGVGAELEEATELAWRGGGPEGEFLHEGGLFAGYKGFESVVEVGEVRVRGDRVE